MFHKVMFTSTAHGATAGLIVDSDRLDPRDMAAVSRLYPASEAPKMRRYHVSPGFATFTDAFGYVFPINGFGDAQTLEVSHVR